MIFSRPIVLIFVLMSFLAAGQGEFNNWHLSSGVSITFNNGAPQLSGVSSISTNEGSAAVSDCQGNLLFYTDGQTIWNSNHQIMQNGSGLAGQSSNTSPALIAKQPGVNGIYYVFKASGSQGFTYSVVNMNADGGLGGVIQRNTLLNASGTGKIAVTYHANGTDIWVVTHYSGNARYDAFLLTATGLSAPVTSIGVRNHQSDHGDMVISPDGSKIACVEDNLGFGTEAITLADFNNSTGQITNEAVRNQSGDPHGCEFSANSRFLYINSTSSGIYQFDCSAGNNSANLNARRLIGSTPIYGSLRRGPDDNVYFTGSGNSYLGRINNSNSINASVNYNYLFVGGGRMGYGIINATLIGEEVFQGPNAILAENACFGTPVDFSLLSTDNILEVRWDFDDPNSGFLNSSFSNAPTHEFTAPGTYDVTAEVTYGCGSEILQLTVVIEETPTMNYQDSVEVCADIATNIGVNSENGVDYQWSPSTFLNSSTIANPTFTHTGTQETEYYTYVVTATSQISQCAARDTVVVDLTTPLFEPIMDFPLCAGDTVEVGEQARADYTYGWLPTTNIVSASGSPVQMYNEADNATNDIRNYARQISFNGCTLNDIFTVNFRSQIELTPPESFEVCALEEVVLNPAGNSNWNYNWSANDGLLVSSNSTSPTYSKDYLGSGKDTIWVYAQIQDEIGCPGLDSVEVIVSNRAGIQDYQYLCPGFGTILNPFGEGIDFSWTPNHEIVTDSSANPNVSPLQDTVYYLTVTDIYNCTYFDSVFVEVNPRVPTELGNDTSICFGDTANLGVSYADQRANYLWAPNTYLDRDDSAHVQAFPIDTTEYILTVSIDTCSGRDTVVVNVKSLPNVQIENDTNICFGDTVSLTASGATQYFWGPDSNLIAQDDTAIVFPIDTFAYFVKGTDSLGCSNYDTVQVGVWDLPTIELINDTSLCFGDSIQLNPTSNGTAYSWSPEDGISNSSELNPYFASETSSTYALVVLDDNGCEKEDSVSITVHPLPVINMTSDTIVCNGDSAELWATGGTSYLWTPSSVANQNDQRTQGFVPEPNILYQVEVTTNEGCVDSSVVMVEWNEQPEAIFDYRSAFGCDGFTVEYFDSSLNATSYSWNLGNGQSSQSRFPVVTYPFGFSGEVSLTVGNNDVCFDTATKKWDFDDLSEVIKIDAVNLITPNQDNVNDCFYYEINGDFEDCDKLQVFNRWGLKVYDSEDASGCFNGINIYNNRALNVGTYFYILEINGYIRNGFIEVIP